MCWRDCGTASDLLIRRGRLNRAGLLYTTPSPRGGGGGAFSADDVGAIVDGHGDKCPRRDLTGILVVADLACDVDRGTVCRGGGGSEIASLVESVVGPLDITLVSSIAGARADARIVVCECLVGATIEDINDVVDDEVERSGPEIDGQRRIIGAAAISAIGPPDCVSGILPKENVAVPVCIARNWSKVVSPGR